MFYKYFLVTGKVKFFSAFIIIFTALFCIRISAQVNAFIRDGAPDPAFSALPGETGSGEVNAIIRLPDGKTLIGGRIPSIAGIVTRDVARLNPDGSPDTTFNTGTGSDGTVTRLHLQPDGKILVSGGFTVFNGVQRRFIVRLNSDGSVDPSFNFTSSPSEQIQVCDVQPDGKFLVCGNFTSINGLQRRQLARLNPDGSLDTGFTYTYTNTNYVTIARVLPSGKILTGGVVSSGPGVFRVNADGSFDNTFTIGAPVGLPLSPVLLPDGKFLITGDGSVKRVYKFNEDGSLDPAFTITNDFERTIRSIALTPDGKIIAAGDFNHLFVGPEFVSRYGIARLNGDGTLDRSFLSPMNDLGNNDIYSVAVEPDGKILMGGPFSQVGNAAISSLARLNSDGSLDNTFLGVTLKRSTVFSQYLYPDGKIFVGGNFNMLNVSPRKYIGRLNPDGNVDNSFVPTSALEGVVRTTVRQPDGKFLVGGSTSTFGNKALWRINADGSLDSSFDIIFNNTTHVAAIALQTDSKILIGGGFSSVNGAARRGLARLNPDGTVDSSFDVNFGAAGGGVKAFIVQADGKIIIGGDFFEVNGNTSARNIARLNTDGSLDTSFVPNTNGAFNTVDGLYRLNGRNFVAGRFSANDSSSRSFLIRTNENGTVDWSFDSGNAVGRAYTATALPNGKILVGGEFNTFAASGNRKHIVRLMENGNLDYTFDAGTIANSPTIANVPPPSVYQASVTNDNNVLISGSFDFVQGQTRWSMAELKQNPCVTHTASDFDGDGKTDVSVFRPSDGIWYLLSSYNASVRAFQFGLSEDKVVSADFDNDGRADLGIFRPSNGVWYIINSSSGSYRVEQFGADGDLPYPADYDGDGLADLAVFRPSTGIWYLLRSSLGFTAVQFGVQDDIPVVADYDGDCKSDIAIFRPSLGQWWIQRSTAGTIALQFGNGTDKPVQGDYTADGKADIAIFRSASGEWFVLRSEDYSYYAVPFGLNGDIPTPGDYDADGISDTAVFRPANGNWYMQRSTAGFTSAQFGLSNDKPVPGALIP